jgi:hypothetical protein
MNWNEVVASLSRPHKIWSCVEPRKDGKRLIVAQRQSTALPSDNQNAATTKPLQSSFIDTIIAPLPAAASHSECRHRFSSRLSRHSKYRLNKKAYMELFERQNGRCAICGREEWEFRRLLCVDHDPLTEHVRGLLCDDCNLGLGKFKHDPALLRKAIKYLVSFCHGGRADADETRC